MSEIESGNASCRDYYCRLLPLVVWTLFCALMTGENDVGFDLFSAITEVRWLAVACRLDWWRETDKEPPCGEAGDLAMAIRGYTGSIRLDSLHLQYP
jgi:hypothetical protein